MYFDPKDHPTQSELAQLAASLTAGKSRSDYPAIIDDALFLFRSCGARLEAIHDQEKKNLDELNKKHYGPMGKSEFSLNELLRYAYPKTRTVTERNSRFREFLNYYLAEKAGKGSNQAKGISLDDRNNFLKELQKDSIGEDQYTELIWEVQQFNKLKRKQTASKAGRASAKKRKKSLD